MQHDMLTRRSAVHAHRQRHAGHTTRGRFVTGFTVLIERLATAMSAAWRGSSTPERSGA
jgi:hypothetical protein